MSADVTLQINLSAGDVAYAATTVPRLVSQHRAGVREVVAVVDTCRPQKTQMIDPDVKLPQPAFGDRVKQIVAIAEDLLRDGTLDRIVLIRPGDPRTRMLLEKYVGWLISETHDCYGVGLVSYLYGFDEAQTRYVLHYDADMLLHQAAGYDWAVEATGHLAREPRALCATPRVSPPFADRLGRQDRTSLHESDVRVEVTPDFWRVGWFSARCYLMDLERLRGWVPLLSPRDPRYFVEVFVRRFLQRGYPPPTEILIYRRACLNGAWRLDLRTDQAYLLHPAEKGARFLGLLPHLTERIDRGDIPIEQLGWENLKLEAWGA